MTTIAAQASTDLWLPPTWRLQDETADPLDVGSVVIQRIGLSAESEAGGGVYGSAAGLALGSERRRAHFELLERIATAEFLARSSDVSEYAVTSFAGASAGSIAASTLTQVERTETFCGARSNGVASGATFAQAKAAAALELVERDLVLRSWFGESRPTILDASLANMPEALSGH